MPRKSEAENVVDLQEVPRLQLSIEEAAAALRMPITTLDTLRKDPDPNAAPYFFMVGRRWYTTVELIREWQDTFIAQRREVISRANALANPGEQSLSK